jgi:hypothetical protein
MKVTFIIGLALELSASLHCFAQSSTQPNRGPLGTPPDSVSSPQTNKTSTARDNYVGDEACGSCHREELAAFHQTAHALTSRLPDKHSILGRFTPDDNVVKTSNPDLLFRMNEQGSDFFQTVLQGMAPYTTERTEQIGLVIGSGGKGQTYLFWKGDQLFQLPVSYWTQLGWVNSPGYRDGVVNFDRPIIPRCLECHATYFESDPPPANRYVKTGFVVGITCEKCHGSGREHVQRESSKTGRSPGSAMRNPAKFERDRQMDLCAWCHAGAGTPLVPSFSYLPGEPLSKYLEVTDPAPNAEIDVHGSQVELLKKSRCFQSSAMTCLTCHDVHTVQHDRTAFSRRCLGCHKPGTAMFPKLGHQVAGNCIECHMPMQDTNLIVFDSNGKKARPRVRNHWIRVYSVATEHR